MPNTSRSKRSFVPDLDRIGDQTAITSLPIRNGSFAGADSQCEHDKTGGRSPPFRSVFVAAVGADREDDLVPEVGQIGPVVGLVRHPIVAVCRSHDVLVEIAELRPDLSVGTGPQLGVCVVFEIRVG
jgi:hypothetical protein